MKRQTVKLKCITKNKKANAQHGFGKSGAFVLN